MPPYRGPAKGYIEALETRLKETERALWRLISVVSTETLSTAFSDAVTAQIPSSLSVTTLETTEEKKSAIAYWEQVPIQSAEEVLAWKDSVDHLSPVETDRTRNPGEATDHTRRHQQQQQRHQQQQQLEQNDARSWTEPSPSAHIGRGENWESGDTNEESVMEPTPTKAPPTLFLETQENIVVTDDDRQAPEPVDRLKRRRDDTLYTSNRSDQTEIANKFGLSKDFQDTFLW